MKTNRKPKQLSFLPKVAFQFGGSLLCGKRKDKRPLSTKLPMHLVIKSATAKSSLSFVAHQQKIKFLIYSTATKYGIRIYDIAVNFNHIHFVLQLPSLTSYKVWIREVTSKIVAHLQTKTDQRLKNFFELRPFTRILNWGRDFKRALEYLILNQLEVFGMRPTKKPKSQENRARNPVG